MQNSQLLLLQPTLQLAVIIKVNLESSIMQSCAENIIITRLSLLLQV